MTGQHGQATQKPAAEGRSPPRGLQREPLPRRHPADGPSWRAERRNEREAADAAAKPGRACRGERPARRDAQQRGRPGRRRVQDQCRILSPVCEPAQTAGIGPADAGTVRRHQPQSQLARHRPEQLHRQPRIGQAVTEKNRPAALRPGNLHRDHAAVAPAHLHPPMVSRSGRAAANLPARPPNRIWARQQAHAARAAAEQQAAGHAGPAIAERDVHSGPAPDLATVPADYALDDCQRWRCRAGVIAASSGACRRGR
jgi:hypothetical protein